MEVIKHWDRLPSKITEILEGFQVLEQHDLTDVTSWFELEVGLGDLQRCLPSSTMLWFHSQVAYSH